MGLNVGDLFVSLGFSYDETGLKQFHAGVTGAVGQLTDFIDKAGQGAVKINNIATQLGVTTQAVQTFANALHSVNPAVSLEAAQDKYAKFAAFVKAQIEQGQAGSSTGALARLGAGYHQGATVEELLSNIRHNKKSVMAQLGPNGQAIYSNLLDQTGLGAETNRLFDMNDKQYANYGRFNVSQESLDNLQKFEEKSAKIGIIWNKIKADTGAAANQLIDNPDKFLDEFVAESHAARAYGIEKLKDLGDWGGGVASWVRRKLGLKEHFGNSPTSSGATPSGSNAKNKQESINFWQSMGLTPQGVAAMVANEGAESGFDAGARGDGGHAFGSFQWHRDRALAILAKTGIDVTKASHADQLKAAAWELQHKYGSTLEQLQNFDQNPANLGYLVSRDYEGAVGQSRNREIEARRRGGMAENEYRTLNVTMNINSNATDPRAVADHAVTALQRQLNASHAQQAGTP